MSIAKNTGYNVAGSVLPILVSIITVPVYIALIGIERYGILSLCWLMMGYMSFLNLGLGPALTQMLAASRDAEPQLNNKTFWTGFWLNLVMGLAGAAVLLLFSKFYFGSMAGISSSLGEEVRQAVPVIAAIAPVVMLNAVLVGALQGREQFAVTNIVSALSTTLMALLPLGIALAFGPNLGWLVIGALTARLIGVAVLFWRCVTALPLTRPITAVSVLAMRAGCPWPRLSR